jgi:hypothetical protein
MSLRPMARKLGLASLLGAVLVTAGSPALAGPLGCNDGCCDRTSCDHHNCPPKYIHCMEGPPRIKYKCGCGKPVCNPCSLPHFGYYRPCWQPYPFPPDWSHCQGPAPGTPHELPVQMLGTVSPSAPRSNGTLPAPRKPEGEGRNDG